MHFFCTYASMGFADAFVATKEALKRQEFSILAEIDMHQVLIKHLSADLRPFLILKHLYPAVSSSGHQGRSCDRFTA